MAETCSPRKIGPGTNPLGSGVSKCRHGERRTTFFALVFQLGATWILNVLLNPRFEIADLTLPALG